MDTITVNYAIKYYIDFAPNYVFLSNKKCYNSKTGRFIKKVENNRCYGYIINGKFKSLTYLKKHLVKNIDSDCPF